MQVLRPASMTEEPDRQPIWPDTLRVVASLVLTAVGVYVTVAMLWPYPELVLWLGIVIGGLASFGVISGLGGAAATLRCRKRQNWVRFVGDERLWYEERAPEGPVRGLSFGCARARLGPWHVLGGDVLMPREDEWNRQVPEWARGRRAQIKERIVDAFGGGTLFRFRSAADQADAAVSMMHE